MIKKINSSTGNFEEQVTDTLVLDAVPTVNSFNTVTSDGVARAIAGASGEVPVVTENDNGKVLTAVYDAGGPAVEWQEAQGGSSYTAGEGIEISNGEIKAKVASGTALHVGNVPVATGSIATKDMAMTRTTNTFDVTIDPGITLITGYYTAKVVVTDGNGNTAVSVNACTPFYWNTIFSTQSVPINTTFDLTEGWDYSEGFDQSIMDHYNAYAFIAYNSNGDRVGITGLSGSTSVLTVQEYSKEVALYSEIPAATAADGQKFLMAHPNTAPTYETVSQVPPPAFADTGKVLTVGVGGAYAWQRAGVPTPNPTSSDNGKVLKVQGTEYGWYENSPAVPDDSLLTLEHRILDRNQDFALSSLAYFKQVSPMYSLPYGDLVDGHEYTVRFVLQKGGESAMAVSVPTLQYTYPGYGSSLMWGTIDVAEYGWTYIDSSASDWNQIHYGGCDPKFQLTDSVTGDVYYTEPDWTIEAYYPKDGKLRINALPGNNGGDILRWDSNTHGYVPQGFELPYQYMECHKFWGGEYATYTSNDVTIAPDFSQDEDWNGYIDLQGYAHCREAQMYGKFEGDGTTAATNNASTTVTLVMENRFDNTDTYTLALNAKQYVKNYVVDPQGSPIQRHSIMFCTEDFQIPFDCNARKSSGTDYFLKSIHVAFAGLTSGGTALGPDSTSIAFRTSTYPYWE